MGRDKSQNVPYPPTGRKSGLSRIRIGYLIDKNWSIGILRGTSPIDWQTALITERPVISAQDVTDIPGAFVADPFMVRDKKQFYMFFEVYNAISYKGEIAYATSSDGMIWNYGKRILSDKYHLSYPYVFFWGGTYYMIPESVGKHAIQLYKAIDFPTEWVFSNTLINGDYVDSSIIYHDNKWWLFATEGKYNLFLFYANEISGPWVEHPKSPIVEGNAANCQTCRKSPIFSGENISICTRLSGEDRQTGLCLRSSYSYP